MIGDVLHPQRPRVGDQLPEQAAPFRPVVDGGDLALVQADRDELGQAAALPDDAECAIAGVHQAGRRLDDLPEHDLKIQVAADRYDGLEQRVYPVPGCQHGLQPGLQLGKEVIEAQVRQQRA